MSCRTDQGVSDEACWNGLQTIIQEVGKELEEKAFDVMRRGQIMQLQKEFKGQYGKSQERSRANKSIQDTRKITSAMYLISSTKMKKSKKLLADTEPYFTHTSERSTGYSASYAGYPACVF